jgi:pyruvate dehydrogenase E2 component (dihydrolipoamide acetyltransferase)
MLEATLTAWHVDVGQVVEVGQPVADLETEKAAVEYVADIVGVVADLLAKIEQPIAVGAPLVLLATGGESIDDARRAAAGDHTATAAGDDTASPPGERGPGDQTAAPLAAAPPAVNAPTRRRATPIVRRLAADRGIDLALVKGTGPGGRIVRRDIEHLPAPALTHNDDEAQTAAPEAVRLTVADPESASAGVASATRPAGKVTAVPHSAMRRAIARRLTESKATVPHFYLTARCRVDRLQALRERLNGELGQHLSLNDFVVKAIAGALSEIPEMNAVWTEDAVLRYADVDIAVAVALDDGLVTPIVRNVAARSVGDVSASLKDLAQRARSRSLRQSELEGGAFTVSNLGMYGTTQLAAIINPPHSGILAVGAAVQQPVVESGTVTVGTVMTVTLSADHRVIDGAVGARWLAAFVRRVENPMSILV